MNRLDAPAVPSGAAGAPDADARRRKAARWTAFRRHPVLWLTRRLRPLPGNSLTTLPPSGKGEVLDRLTELPVSVWTYGWDHDQVRHLGPMAQDFARTFGLGGSDRHIDMVDAAGVCMAAIQALEARLADVEKQLADLRQAAQPSAGSAAAPASGDTRSTDDAG